MSARSFAITAHGDQQYGDRPYVEHLDAVAAVVSGWGMPDDLVNAAYLHDVLEDTATAHHEIIDPFGWAVFDIVYACTAEPLLTREQAMASIYRKVALNGNAALVKLADRIANVEASEPGSRHAVRYLSEHRAFSAALKPYVPPFAWDRYVTGISALIVESEGQP
jgi:(p)ppGpp synthase/HD superfamily hydrolase